VAFDLQPVLKGKLVELRPLRADDFDELYAVAGDPLIWEQHPVKNRCEEEGFKVFFREAMASGGALIAIDAETRRVIGSSRFHRYDEEKNEVEIGWTFLARSHWGGPYNGEMKRLMLEHAFRFVGSVLFVVGVENWRSQRAVEKIGGVRVASRPDAGGRDSYVYKITASTFAHSRRIGLIGCVKEKAAGRRAAKELYVSNLFAGRRSFVERTCDQWWILSAKHALVHPDDVLAPYDVSLKTAGRPVRREWSTRVLAAIDARVRPVAGDVFEIHASADYREFGLIEGLRSRGCVVEVPTRGIGLGQQLKFYRQATSGVALR
jgi:RimJ/RimL family protein N-acetyltransferase